MITEAQKIERAKLIGSSDVACLLGHGYQGRTAADLFLEKTGRLEPEPEAEAADRGNRLEPVIIDYAQDEIGETLLRNQRFICSQLPILAANCDAIAPIAKNIVEAKSCAVAENWQDDSEPPESVIAQCHAQFLCSGFEIGWVPVLLPFLRFKLYRVERNADLCNLILDEVAAFEKCLKTDTPPENVPYTLEVVKRRRRTPGKTIDIPAGVAEACALARDMAKAAEKGKKFADAQLLAAMQDADTGYYPGGKVVLQTINRSGFTVDPTSFQQMKIQPTKGLK